MVYGRILTAKKTGTWQKFRSHCKKNYTNVWMTSANTNIHLDISPDPNSLYIISTKSIQEKGHGTCISQQSWQRLWTCSFFRGQTLKVYRSWAGSTYGHKSWSQKFTMLQHGISLGDLEGDLINNATVYLRDNLLDVETNLSEEDYTFTAAMGNQKERFTLVFGPGALDTNDISLQAISVYPNPAESILTINSPMSNVNSVVITDISGRQVAFYNFTDQNSYQIDVTEFGTAVYFVEVNTDNGSVTKRIIKE